MQKLQNDHNLKVPGGCQVKSISIFDEKIRINHATEDAGLNTMEVDSVVLALMEKLAALQNEALPARETFTKSGAAQNVEFRTPLQGQLHALQRFSRTFPICKTIRQQEKTSIQRRQISQKLHLMLKILCAYWIRWIWVLPKLGQAGGMAI